MSPKKARPSATSKGKPSKNRAAGNPDVAQPGAFKAAYTPSSMKGSVDATGTFPGATAPYSRQAASYSVKAKKKGSGKKILIAVCLVLVMILAGAGTAAALYINSINATLSGGNEEEINAVKEVLTPASAVSTDPFYMMLIGCDDREDVDGARSDTNIMARVDAGTGKVTLISIPRDTAITIDGYGTQKFNAAYAYGQAPGTIKEANELLGVQTSHYAEIHFDALISFIDAIGGVEVDVPIEIDSEDAGGHVDAGLQTLDGEHAMIFARCRDYVTGDFQRTSNQRLLIEAVINKVMSLPANELPGTIQKMAECVTTDMNVSDILGYAMQFRKVGVTMYSAMVPSSTAEKDGISYVVCDTATLTKMMKVVEAGEDPSTVTVDNTVSSSAEAQANGSTGTAGSSSSSSSYGSTYYNDYSNDYSSDYYDPNYDPNYSYDGSYETYAPNSSYPSEYGYGSDSGYSDYTYDSGSGYTDYSSGSGTGYDYGYDASAGVVQGV